MLKAFSWVCSAFSIFILTQYDLVYDVTNRSTFENIKCWDENVGYYTNNPNIVKMLVGNKIDLVGIHYAKLATYIYF